MLYPGLAYGGWYAGEPFVATIQADSSDIDSALVAKLGSDPALLALMPNGVYFDLAPPNSTRFVLVSLVETTDARSFDGRSYEDIVYSVKAVALSSTNTDIRAAAARIDQLLEGGTLTVPNYVCMAMHREGRIRTLDLDDLDPTIRWSIRGGRYRVVMSL